MKELLHTLHENDTNWSWLGTDSVGFLKSALFSISMERHDQASEKESGDNIGMSFASCPKNQWMSVSTAVAAGRLFNTAWNVANGVD